MVILYDRTTEMKSGGNGKSTSSDHPHNSNPNPASAAALRRHEDAATSAAGALDADPNGSDATAE